MSLLHGLNKIRRLKKIELEVAHVDHAVRAESGEDCRFVHDFASKLGLPFHSRTLSRCPEGENFEAWARTKRYEFFDEIVRERNIDWVLTAHTANDVAENFLMRIISNKEANGISEADVSRKIARPLLGVSRCKVEEYIRENAVPFRHDVTNDDMSFLRNRVRHVLVPFLKEHFGATAFDSVGERALLVAEDESYLTQLSRELAKPVLCEAWGGPEFIATFKSAATLAPHPLKWRLSEEVLRPCLGFSVGSRQASEFHRFVVAGNGRFCLAGGIVFEWSAGMIRRIGDGGGATS